MSHVSVNSSFPPGAISPRGERGEGGERRERRERREGGERRERREELGGFGTGHVVDKASR